MNAFINGESEGQLAVTSHRHRCDVCIGGAVQVWWRSLPTSSSVSPSAGSSNLPLFSSRHRKASDCHLPPSCHGLHLLLTFFSPLLPQTGAKSASLHVLLSRRHLLSGGGVPPRCRPPPPPASPSHPLIRAEAEATLVMRIGGGGAEGVHVWLPRVRSGGRLRDLLVGGVHTSAVICGEVWDRRRV